MMLRKSLWSVAVVALSVCIVIYFDPSELTRLTRVAEQGDANAQFELGLLHTWDQKITGWSDYTEVREVADTGLHWTMGCGNDVIYVSDADPLVPLPEPSEIFGETVVRGVHLAYGHIEHLLHSSDDSVPKDHVMAAKWFGKAAEQGHVKAQNALGIMYALGRGGVEKDAVEAISLYRKSADQGYAFAQHNLGLMYALGSGVEKDSAEAYKWTNLAAIELPGTKALYDKLEENMSKDAIVEGLRRAAAFKPKTWEEVKAQNP